LTTCHCCGGKAQKRGSFKNKNWTVQRYFCGRCGKTFSDKQPLDGLRVDFKLACQVVNLLCESMGIRAIARITGLNQETVLNILETAGQKAAQFLDSSVHDVHADFVAADEIHTFVYSKEMNTDGRHKDRGEQYTFFAIDRRSKLILSWLVGKRTAWNAEDFLADVKKRVANRFQLNTDNWNGYGCTVQDVFGNEIDHAVETKYFAKPERFLPRRIIGIRRRAKIGMPDLNMASTAHAERTNLTARTFTARFNRCSLKFSKTIRNLRNAVALFVWQYNFVRPHGAHGFTPAFAAGVAPKEPMTIEQLLRYEGY
jgi:transposase-like protein/IS1 family transposase